MLEKMLIFVCCGLGVLESAYCQVEDSLTTMGGHHDRHTLKEKRV